MILIKQDLKLARAEVERLKSRCDSWEEKYQAEIKLRQEERAKLCQEIEALKEVCYLFYTKCFHEVTCASISSLQWPKELLRLSNVSAAYQSLS